MEGMKKTLGLGMVIVLLLAGGLRAQACDPQGAAWARMGKTPTILALIVGNHDHLSPEVWSQLADKMAAAPAARGQRALHLLHAGRAAEASKLLAPDVARSTGDSIPDSSLAADALADLEVAGLAALAEGKPAQAAQLFAHAHARSGDRLRCRLRVETLLARYLQRYGMDAPLQPHYNSGFYNYLEDSLRWSAESPAAGAYVVAINAVARMLEIDRARQALYLELLGDLLSKEPSRFNANYLSGLAYLRAAGLLQGQKTADMERKALFALEAPRQREDRFNLYRFTQLKKALAEDVDSAAARAAADAARDQAAMAQGGDPWERFGGMWDTLPVGTAFLPTDGGRLPALLARSKDEITAHNEAVKRYAGDVDLKKEVKKDSRFNAFAIVLILTIVAAVLFIFRKLQRASRAGGPA